MKVRVQLLCFESVVHFSVVHVRGAASVVATTIVDFMFMVGIHRIRFILAMVVVVRKKVPMPINSSRQGIVFLTLGPRLSFQATTFFGRHGAQRGMCVNCLLKGLRGNWTRNAAFRFLVRRKGFSWIPMTARVHVSFHAITATVIVKVRHGVRVGRLWARTPCILLPIRVSMSNSSVRVTLSRTVVRQAFIRVANRMWLMERIGRRRAITSVIFGFPKGRSSSTDRLSSSLWTKSYMIPTFTFGTPKGRSLSLARGVIP